MNIAPEASDRHRARRKARARQRRVAAWGVRVGAVGVGVVLVASGLSQPVAAATRAADTPMTPPATASAASSVSSTAVVALPAGRSAASRGSKKRVRRSRPVRPVSVPGRPVRKPVRAKPKPAPAPDKVVVPGKFSASVPVARKAKIVKGLVSLASPKPGLVAVVSLGVKRARALGGSLFAVSVASPGATKPVTVGLRVAGIKGAAGGSFSARLGLAVLGSCASPGPCPPKLLATTRGGKDWLSAPVPVGSAPVVVGVVADASGSSGDYAAAPMSPAGVWAQGGSGGGFSYSLPVATPPSVGGGAPGVALSYSSQVTDARSTGANGQSSWVGEGWDYDPGYIGQTYVPCIDNGASPAAPVGDACWASPYSDKTQPAAVLHLGGQTVPLVWDAVKGWRTGADDGWRVQRVGNGPNGTAGGWYWLVDDLVGNRYWFGYGKTVSDASATNSVATEPVFSLQPDQPCYYNANPAADACTSGYQFHLDRMVDANGNTTEFTYASETNYYTSLLASGTGKPVLKGYTSAIYPASARYGFNPAASGASPAAKVAFVVKGRCVSGSGANPLGEPGCKNLISKKPADFPDVPADLICTGKGACAHYSPTFFTQNRLSHIDTFTAAGAGWTQVARTGLSVSFPDKASDPAPDMWLNGVQTQSLIDGTVAPMTGLVGVQLNNRLLPKGSKDSPLPRTRLTQVTNTTGGQVNVAYGQNNACVSAQLKAAYAWSSNTRDCFPAWIDPDGPGPAPSQWAAFNKYLVTSVTAADPVGGSPNVVTNYTYNGTGAWAWTDAVVTAKRPAKNSYQTWDQWRGYQQVSTAVSGASGSRVDYFFRGMNGTRDSETSGTPRTVNVTDAAGTSFADSVWLGGRVLQSRTLLAGVVVGSTSTGFWANQSAPGSGGLPAHAAVMVRPNSTVFTRPISGGTQTLSTSATFTSDYGLVSSVARSGTGITATCAGSTYQDPTVTDSLLLVDLPYRVSTFSGSDCSGTPLNQSVTHYDGSFGPTVTLTHGNPTFRQEWVSDNDADCVITQAGFDAYGRVTSATSPAGVVTTTTYAPAVGGFATSVATSTSAPAPQGGAAWTSSTSLRAADGAVTSQSDPNGRVSSFGLDGFARATSVTKNNVLLASFTYPPSAAGGGVNLVPPRVVSNRLLDTGVFTSSTAFSDGFGRARETQTASPTGGRIVEATVYNGQGWPGLVEHAVPNDNPSTAALLNADPNGVASETLTGFDGLGRVTSSSVASMGVAVFTTNTTYNANLVTVSPPTGGGTVSTLDVLGRSSQVQRFAAGVSGVNRSTSLSYDPVGNLSGFSRGGQSWSYSFDQLGRRTRAVDPDTGTTIYGYDSSSNLTSTTSNGRLVSHTFDTYNRPLATFDGDTTTGTVLSSTAYVSAAPNLGAVASSSSFDAGVEYKSATSAWDGFGRALNTVFTVPSGGLAPAELAGSFTNNYTYRAGGGIKTVGYSFGGAGGIADETVTPTITSLGLPASLSVTAAAPGSVAQPVVTGSGFDASGLPLSRSWAAGASGVGLNRAYGFDPVRRIPTSITTNATTSATTGTGTGAGAVSTPVVAETISYDGLARPTSITDTVTGTAAQTRCFGFSGYSELANAWTQAANTCPSTPPAATSATWNTGTGSSPFWASWVFDNDTGHVGGRVDGNPANLASPVSTVYNYDNAQHPDAVSSSFAGEPRTGPVVFTGYQYDADGQRSSRADLGGAPDTEAITWTASHQPASITTPGGDTRFVHNPDGTRLIRATPTSTTVYLGDSELTADTATRAVTARRAYSLGGAQVAFRDTSTGSANLVFTAADTQGSASLQVDPASFTTTTGWVAASYTPYGTQRLQTPDSQPWAGDHDWLNKPADASTGLTQTDQRLYDPGLQQFINPDPLLAPLTPNPYTYAANNPITGADPSGLWCLGNCDSGGSGGGWCMGTCEDHGTGGAVGGNSVIRAVNSGMDHVAHWMTHGSGQHVASAVTGFGDGASFGASRWAREKISPGSSKQVKEDNYYKGGEIAGIVASSVAGGEILGGGVAAARGGLVAYRAARAGSIGRTAATEAIDTSLARTATQGATRVGTAGARGEAETQSLSGQEVFRVHGGNARPMGGSWTPEDPRSMVNPRDMLGLPKQNSGQFLSKAVVRDMTGMNQRLALPIPEDGVAGGSPEWVFPDPPSQLERLWTIPIEPPF